MRKIASVLVIPFALMMILLCGISCSSSKIGTAVRPRLSGSPYLVLVDRDTYADALLRDKMDLYFQNVNRLFSFAPTVVVVDPFDPKAPGKNVPGIRDIVKQYYLKRHIAGVILLGKIPFMTWRQAAGITWVNIGPEDFCYGDLDAEFLDQETRYGGTSSDLGWLHSKATNNCDNQLVPGREHAPDGQFETHLSGKNEGPQIWVSRIYAPTNAQYYGYFDKMNDYYRDILNRLAVDKNAVVVPFKDILYTGHPDYPPRPSSPNYQFLDNFSRSLPGSQFIAFGVNAGGTVSELFSNYNSRAYLFAEVDGHANPYKHDLKNSSYSVQDILQKISAGHGALIQALSGCHGGNFSGIKDGLVNLTLAYPLSQGISQAAYGCSWSGGIEETEREVMKYLGQGDYLGLAFEKAQKRLYSKSYMKGLFANEITHRPHYFLPANGTDAERMAVLMTKLLRGHNLMGNPFLKIVYTNNSKTKGEQR